MALEAGSFISDLNASFPVSTDGLAQAADHMRLIKSTIKTSLPNISGAMNAKQAELNVLGGISATAAELNILDGVTSTAAELNILDGVTSTTAKLNHMDGVISNEQTQIDNVGGGLLDYEMHTSSGSIAVPSDCSGLVIKASGGFGGSGGRCHRPWTDRCPRRLRVPVHHIRVGCPAPGPGMS